MNIKQILQEYSEALEMPDDRPPALPIVILDILKYLAENENKEAQTIEQHKQIYINNNLWKEIGYNSSDDLDKSCIELPVLRKILEKYNILADEKDGM